VDHSWDAPVAQAEALLATLTLDQKLALLNGQARPSGDPHSSAGYLPAVVADATALVPAQYLCDGPNGVGNGNTGVTQFPTAMSVAASWDVDLARRYGDAAGNEWQRKGCHYALAPGMNIVRTPYGGRSAEYYSEDPFLSGRIGAATVQGIQGQHVVATVKHYAANNQEIARSQVDVVASERTLREIYLPAFEASIRQGNAGAVMCSYNRVNGVYACEDPWLLGDVLRDGWDFKGLVMTDWGAAHGTVSGVKSGLELEMGSNRYFTPAALGAALDAGDITEADIDRMVLHQLSALFRVGGMDGVPATPEAEVSHPDLALELAQKAAVLLRNAGGALPLDPTQAGLHIAVVGPAAREFSQTAMPGSGYVIPSADVVQVADAVAARTAGTVTYARGSYGTGVMPLMSAVDHTIDYFDLSTFRPATYTATKNATVKTTPGGDVDGFAVQYLDAAGDPLDALDDTMPSISQGADTLFPAYHYFRAWPQGLPSGWSAVFTGYVEIAAADADAYTFNVTARGRAELLVDGATVGVVDERWLDASRTFPAVSLAAGEHTVALRFDSAEWTFLPGTFGPRSPGVSLGLARGDEIAQAVAAAAGADVAVVVVSDREGEETDHIATLPADQDALVTRVAAVAKKTVVVLQTGSGLVLPWADQVDAIVEGWYGGQRAGEAMAGVIFGDVNPSGRTTVTFPVSMDQWYAQSQSQFPGAPLPGGAYPTVDYDEGLLVGYRWFDETQQTPRFAFGHGLSYTTFAYDALATSADSGNGAAVRVEVRVKNTGARAGAEVAQLYVGFPPWAGEPPRQLKGFAKVQLEPGASAKVTFDLDARAFSYWSEAEGAWVVPAGPFQLMVGSSSRDIRVATTYTVVDE
jgi:beta-glucosidase